jgi:predicted dehydrogenase
MTNIRIFMAGAGAIARHHARSMQKLPESQSIPLFVSEPDARTLEDFTSEFPQARCYADTSQMLAQPAQPDDLVIIATPPFLHYPLAALALESGRHVLCEKPLVMTAPQALKLLEIAQAHHKLLADCSSRFVGVPSTERVKELLSQRALGEVYHVSWVNKWQRSRPGIEYQPASKWFLDKSKSGGGPLLDWASYEFSTLNDLFNPTHIEVKHAWLARPQTEVDPPGVVFDIETHGGASMVYSLPGGERVAVTYERSNGTHGAERQFFEIEGSLGALSWDWMMFKQQVEVRVSQDQAGKVVSEVFNVESDQKLTLHDRPLHYMIAAIEGKPNQAILNERAVFNFLCTQALYRVAESGRPEIVYSQPQL